ncbi:MAG: hypothetical protein KGH53_03555 [Candidatus Micrarchaeota archaeon]|nr:hypothetical protein [Candidatus Micrarchaeota archaeon]
MKKGKLCRYVVTAMPDQIDAPSLISSMMGSQFMVVHDFRNFETSIIVHEGSLIAKMGECVPGLEFMGSDLPKLSQLKAFILFPPPDTPEILADAYRIIGKEEAMLLVSFVRPELGSVLLFKKRVEELLSRREMKITRMHGSKFTPSHSVQSDLYYGSDERGTLLGLLSELNLIANTNGSAYKVVLIVNEKGDRIEKYLCSKGLILESISLGCRRLDSLYSRMREIEAAPFSYPSAARYLSFSEKIERKKIVKTQQAESLNGEIEMGRVLQDGVAMTQSSIRISKSSLNLGTILTGLPGTGKSVAAMSIFSQLNRISGERTSIAVIAPTREWGDFAARSRLSLIKFYESKVPINFFSCPVSNSREKFYENLAMLLAHASNAGPYQNSLEKCLLAAFRKVYATELCPDPAEVYMQIEEAIVERHAKRSNAGVKYTKHGENIRAALENLRLMLFRPEFAATEGINLEEILKQGVVFDLSNVGNNMKQFYYALILNRIYSFADRLDEQGNDSLRLEIVLEEAQVALSQNELSAVNLDLKQRIQDFRKKGVGLCLITHSVTDIPASIRRLCQTKLYFRQSSDIARYAAQDLGLETEEQDGIGSLRSLGQGRFAALYLENRNGEKIPRGPIFAKAEVENAKGEHPAIPLSLGNLNMESDCTICLKESGEPLKNAGVELSYLGMALTKGTTDERGEIVFRSLIKDKPYSLAVLGERKKDLRACSIKASESVTVELVAKSPAPGGGAKYK